MRSVLLACLLLLGCTGVVTPPVAAPAREQLPECAAQLNERPSGSVAVVLADGEQKGTAVLVGLDPDRVLGRVELGYQPVVALDAPNRQLLAICSPEDNSSAALVAYSLDDLGVRWSVPLEERILTKVSAWPSILPSVDGRYVFTYHYRTLRPGNGEAPGSTRYWIGVRDARTGLLLREVETPLCSVGLFHQATPDLLFLQCALGGHLRAIRTDTWQEERYHVTSGAIRLSGLTASGDRYIVVTQDLWVLTFDAVTGRQLSAEHWSETAMPVVPFFGRLAMAPDASKLWVPTAPPGYEVRPGTAVVSIDLAAEGHESYPTTNVGAVAWLKERVLYVDEASLRSLDRPDRLDLGVGHRVVAWRIEVAASR